MSVFDDLHDLRCTVTDCATCDLIQRPDETSEQWLARIRALAAIDPDLCKHGHLRTPETEYVAPDGGRQCRQCRTGSDRRYQRRQKVAV